MANIPKITIIIPVFNEISTIDKVIERILQQKRIKKKQLIIVDDFSSDGTKELLKKIKLKSLKIIYKYKNEGKGSAIKIAQKLVSGNIVIIQDADLEYHPKDYIKLIKPIIQKKTNVVYGSRVYGKKRYSKNNHFISFPRIFGNHILTLVSNFLNKQKLTDAHTGYKVFDASLFKRIKLEQNDFSFCPEITTKLSLINENIYEVPISYKGRGYKEGKKISIKDAFKAIYVLFKYRFNI